MPVIVFRSEIDQLLVRCSIEALDAALVACEIWLGNERLRATHELDDAPSVPYLLVISYMVDVAQHVRPVAESLLLVEGSCQVPAVDVLVVMVVVLRVVLLALDWCRGKLGHTVSSAGLVAVRLVGLLETGGHVLLLLGGALPLALLLGASLVLHLGRAVLVDCAICAGLA